MHVATIARSDGTYRDECYDGRMHKLLLLIVLAACGSATPATPRTAPASPAKPMVELAELRFYAGQNLGMQLHADGRLEMKAEDAWVDIGSVAADGTLSAPDGTRRGHITADGSVVGPSGKTAPFHFEGQTLVIADRRFTIDARGMLQGGDYLQGPMRVEGAATPGLKRTALVVLATIMTAGRHTSE
jgi:hypothetical protein